MAAPSADPHDARPRPRPRAAQETAAPTGTPPRAPQRPTGRQLARPQAQSGQVVSAAGGAIVAAAKMGRILGRSGWRIAKQLPGVAAVEQQAQRLRQAATAELGRLLEPQGRFGGTAEEQRALRLAQQGAGDPLRAAMGELLDRSGHAQPGRSREYLFGSVVSQLVPDEARILAALAGGHAYAVVDVVVKSGGRGAPRTVLANASTLVRVAGVAAPQDGATYLTRLHGLGLVEFGSPTSDLDAQFEALSADPAVQAARVGAGGNGRIVRKTVSLTAFGHEFWTACAPPRGPARRADRSGQ